MRIPSFYPIALGLGVGALPLLAQIPKQPEASFFSQPPRTLMLVCAEEAKVLARSRDAHFLAEYGDTQLAAGDRAKAEEAFARAIQVKPNDPQTHHIVALAWLRKGFKKEAMAAFAAMVNVDLSGRYELRKNVLTTAAVRLLEGGCRPEAEVYMEKAYQLDKRDEHNCLAFGRTALLQGQRDLAATYFARAVKAVPDDEDVWIEISNAFADLLKKK